MTKKLWILIFVVFSSISVFSQTSSETEYSQTLKKMFEVSGSEESYQTAIRQMFSMFKQQYQNVETEQWNEIEKEFLKTSLDELTTMLVPVYIKHMTQADLEEIISFYQTPVGKKFAQKTPLIMQESIAIGQQWGMKIGKDFEKKMKEKGY